MPTLESPSTSTAVPALVLTRIIRAPRARIYEAWTKPDILQQWFGPAGMFCPNAVLQVREGGSYRIDVHPDPQTARAEPFTESATREASATGIYTKVVPGEMLQFTWIPSWTPEEESLVTVTLHDVEGGTELTLRHERFLPASSVPGYERGWGGSLDKLAAQLEA